MKTLKDALCVDGYFFVIKRDKIYNDSFTSNYTTDKIAATSFSKKKEADIFHRLVKKEGLIQGTDYVDGIYDKSDGVTFYPNDWLEFWIQNEKCYVRGL